MTQAPDVDNLEDVELVSLDYVEEAEGGTGQYRTPGRSVGLARENPRSAMQSMASSTPPAFDMDHSAASA